MGRGQASADDIFYGGELDALPLPDFEQALLRLAPRLVEETILLFSSRMSSMGNKDKFLKVDIFLERGLDGAAWYRSIFEKQGMKGLLYQGPDLYEAVSSARESLQKGREKYLWSDSLGRAVPSGEPIPLPTDRGVEKEIIQIAAGDQRGTYSGEIEIGIQ